MKFICTTAYDTAVKRKEVLTPVPTWRDLSEMSRQGRLSRRTLQSSELQRQEVGFK
jgi:hypothetical protein